MESRAKDFGPFHDHVWLNAANQGPLPRVAVEAMQEAIREEFVGEIEAITGRKVIAFFSGNQAEPDMSVEVFVLAPPANGSD